MFPSALNPLPIIDVTFDTAVPMPSADTAFLAASAALAIISNDFATPFMSDANDVNILCMLFNPSKAANNFNTSFVRLINSFIADSQDGINILSEYLKDSVIPEDRKKSIIKKATALQKSHEQFISYSEPVLNLKNKDASNEDFSEFYQNLVNINKMNTLQQLTIAENLEKINGNVNNLLLQHGLTRDDLENFTLKSQLPQKDLRFEKELLLEDYYNLTFFWCIII